MISVTLNDSVCFMYVCSDLFDLSYDSEKKYDFWLKSHVVSLPPLQLSCTFIF